MKSFRDINIVFPDGVRKGSITFDERSILSFEASENALSLPEGVYLAPGFLDEHIHGACGRDAMDGEPESILRIADALVQEGVTSFLPTTMTETIPAIEKSLLSIQEAKKKQTSGANIAGIHLEGPFISPIFKGAQAEINIQKPNPALLERFQKLSGSLIRIVTFAYEEDGGEEFLKACLRLHITPSLGHSNATGQEALASFDKGVTSVTHLYNAQSRFHHRDIGIIGATLLRDGVKAEIIADFHHSSKEAIALLCKTKRKEDIVLISDSTEAKGLGEGAKAKLGSQEIHVQNGLALLENGTIAGSILRIDDALRNVSYVAKGYSYSDIVNLATLNPAKNLGLDERLGSIAIGKEPSFALLDSSFHVLATIVNGTVAYRKP